MESYPQKRSRIKELQGKITQQMQLKLQKSGTNSQSQVVQNKTATGIRKNMLLIVVVCT